MVAATATAIGQCVLRDAAMARDGFQGIGINYTNVITTLGCPVRG
jgi:hypothetical protein